MMFIQSMFLSMIGPTLSANSSYWPHVYFADINTFSVVNQIYIARKVQETRSAVALLFWQRSAGENGGRFHALFILRAWWSNSESTFRVPEVFFSLEAGCFGGGRRPTELRPLAEPTCETENREWKVSGTKKYGETLSWNYSSPLWTWVLATDETKLSGHVRLQNSVEILVVGPHMCTKIGGRTMISLPQRKFEKHIR